MVVSGRGALRRAVEIEELPGRLLRVARDFGYADEKDQIVVIAGVPFNVPGTTNILRVAPCDERLILRADPE